MDSCYFHSSSLGDKMPSLRELSAESKEGTAVVFLTICGVKLWTVILI